MARRKRKSNAGAARARGAMSLLACWSLVSALSADDAGLGASSWQPWRVFGQADLRETDYNEVVPHRLFHPGGVVVDRMPAPQPSRVYVWDSGNNRILGFDHIGTCDGGAHPGMPCTENSMCASPASDDVQANGTCTADLNQVATVILGQPAGEDRGSCNRDNTTAAAAGRDRLCAVPHPYQPSPLEGPRGNSMAVDAAHNLYVVDPFNNRILRFDDPLADDGEPDWLWGQPDFSSRTCNRGQAQPAADTLCTGEIERFSPNYYFAAGLDVTADGTEVWVADLGNHRVLRVNTVAGAADLVIGQSDFTSHQPDCGLLSPGPPSVPLGNVRLCKPNSVRYDEASGRLYVLHGDELGRIYVYEPPLTLGMAPSDVYGPPAGSELKWPRGLTLDPFSPDTLWLTDTDNSRLLQYVGGVPTRILSKGDFTTVGCIGGLQGDGAIYPQVCNPHGTLGIDRDGSIYAGDLQEQHVERFPAPIPLPDIHGIAHSPDARLWYGGEGRADHHHINQVGASGLANPGDALIVGQQLVIADRRRIVFWTDYAQGPSAGGPADGVLGQPGFDTQADPSVTHHRDVVALAHDPRRHLLYAAHGPYITAWSTDGGLTSQQPYVFQIQSPLPLKGGGALGFEAGGIAIDAASDSAWVSDASGNRLLRVLKISRPDRLIDVVLGQPSLDETRCNRGAATPSADGFCRLTQVKLDQLGNLYVVDGTWEGNGNRRVLQFEPASLPPIPSPQLFWPTAGPMADRVFAKTSFSDQGCHPDPIHYPCVPRFVSFEPGTNRMLMTVDAYFNPLGSRAFLYDHPMDGIAPQPDGRVPLPFNQAAASDWDDQGRVVILDHTWNRLLLINDPPSDTSQIFRDGFESGGLQAWTRPRGAG